MQPNSPRIDTAYSLILQTFQKVCQRELPINFLFDFFSTKLRLEREYMLRTRHFCTFIVRCCTYSTAKNIKTTIISPFLSYDAYAQCGLCHGKMSVRPSGCHMPVIIETATHIIKIFHCRLAKPKKLKKLCIFVSVRPLSNFHEF